MNKMKLLIATAIFVMGTSAFANVAVLDMNQVVAKIAVAQLTPSDLINWKVGDQSNFNVSLASFGAPIGTMTQSVESDDGQGDLWLGQKMALMGQDQLVEELIRKSDGKVLKMKQNGKEVQVPDEKVEIISQDYTEITVPAGKFKCLHVVAKSQQVSKMELWANPRDTVMDGQLKSIIDTNGMSIVMELTSFKHGS